MGFWVNGRTLWNADVEQVADNIHRAISKEIPVNGYREKSIIIDAINEELSEYTLFKDYDGTEGSIFWRLVIVVWFPLHFIVLTPYCAVKWLFGHGWYLKSDSLLSRFNRRVFKSF